MSWGILVIASKQLQTHRKEILRPWLVACSLWAGIGFGPSCTSLVIYYARIQVIKQINFKVGLSKGSQMLEVHCLKINRAKSIPLWTIWATAWRDLQALYPSQLRMDLDLYEMCHSPPSSATNRCFKPSSLCTFSTFIETVTTRVRLHIGANAQVSHCKDPP